MKKVCSINACWIFALLTVVPGSALHAEDPPSTDPVPPALHNALASSLDKAVSVGTEAIPTPPTGSWGIVAEGDGGGGIFRDSDSEAEAWLGSNSYGVQGFGSVGGGYFKDSDGTGLAKVGWGDYGINAQGDIAGGFFSGEDNQGNAYIGHGSMGISAYGAANGIEAYGNEMGGYFGDLDGTGYAKVGSGDRGIEAYGYEMGGYFTDITGYGYAWVGFGNHGIEAYGLEAGGYFKDVSAYGGYAYLGYGERGIEAYGHEMGGYFGDVDDTGFAYVGYGDTGIEASGNSMGGHFKGTEMGGYFEDEDESGYAHVAIGHYGIKAYGLGTGGTFGCLSTSANASVGTGTYKIFGTGSMNFVQNHPHDPSSVIVYAAPEGDEVATYTRGTARLVEGEARVALGETFQWVTNPDIGLTAHLTPRGEPIPLAVIELSTEEMIVSAPADAPEGLQFDYMVYGLRIGFEESSIVQEKKIESYIPSMADHRQLYERRPDLRNFNSLERFKGMHHAVSPKAKLDLSRAQALRNSIIEFDPAIHELPMPPGQEGMPEDNLALEETQRGAVHRVRAARGDHDRQSAPDHSDLSAAIPVGDGGNIYAPSSRLPSREVVTLVDLTEPVKPGDVLVIDRDTAGLMRRGFEGHDSGVVGVVLDSQSPALSGEEVEAETALHAEVAIAGVVNCKVDATYGAIWPGNLLVTSPTSGHAMRTESPLPGTIVGKALEPLEEGKGTIRVLVMLR